MRKLFNRLHLYFIPKTYWDDEHELRKAKMLVNTTLLSAFFAFFYLFNTLFFQMGDIRYNMVFCIIAFSVLPFLFKAGASRVTIANAFSAIALFSTAFDIYFSQGLYSWSMAWLSMSPVLAVLLIDKRYGYLWLVIAILIGCTVGVMHMKGYKFPNDVKPEFMSLITLNAALGLIAIMFFIVLAFDNAYNSSIVKLHQKTQQIEWEKLMAEQERLRAQRSEQAKQQFLANMSHEIRTPINALVGITNILIEKKPTEEQRRYLDIIQKSTDTLRVIINDILDITKIEVGKMSIERIRFAPKEVIDLVTTTLQYKTQANGLMLKVDYDNDIPGVLIGDPTRLNQVLINLLDNAIKFTEKGSITLKAERIPTGIRFTIADTGIGMTPEQLAIIFEPFRQGESGTTRKYGGTGLGLSISKRLVELQGGQLNVTSTPGKGSVFTFTIEYETSEGVETLKKDKLLSPEKLDTMKNLRILIAEDNEFNRVVAAETLQLKLPGATIDVAHNGAEVLKKLSNHDIVLMDVHMPIMDGFEATGKIRNEFPSPINEVPIIALTASVIQSDINKCYDAGMNGFVPKPFNATELLTAIYDVLNKKPQPAFTIIQPDATESNGFITNLTFLKDSCNNDAEKIKKYINMYLQTAPQTIEHLQKSSQNNDYTAIKNTLHVFKVHLKYMGMAEAETIARTLEEYCIDNKHKDEIPGLVNILGIAYRQSVTELSKFSSHSGSAKA